MKVNVKFANGNGMAFLGQGYITYDDKMDKGRLELAFICALADCLGEQNVSVEDFLGMHTELIYNAVNTEYAVEFLNDYNAVRENGFMYECRHLCDGSPSRTRIEFDF